MHTPDQTRSDLYVLGVALAITLGAAVALAREFIS